MNDAKLHIAMLLLLTVLTGCRRDLWVYTDQFKQVEIVTDWSEATEQPGGMTWWLMKDDHSGNYHSTTADVTHSWIGVPQGLYSGVVFDYSPAEYSHQEFVGLEHISSALVHVTPSADQPQADEELYGTLAVGSFAEGISHYEPTGMYTVAAEPEVMNADTLHHVNIVSGYSDERVLWDEADKYETNTKEVQTLYAFPKPIVRRLNVTVHVRGITYMNSVTASVAGLTDGCWLGQLRNTSTPCLQQLDGWTRTRSAEEGDVGILTTSVNTFGLQDKDMSPSPYDARVATRAPRANSVEWTLDGLPNWDSHLRLNLRFLLRDLKTVLYYHYDVDSQWLTIDEGRLVIDIVIPIEVSPDLPYVDEANSAGFDAEVTPWADGGTADETM